jgi:cytidine deaminase
MQEESEWSCEVEYVRTRPFVNLGNQDPAYQVTVRLKRFLQRVAEAPLEADFHRLSGRVVLAVVMIRRVDGTYEFYEGVNTEVAIQTGSLCAERAAIAAARADIPNLARFEICAIATIYAPLTKSESEPSKNPSWPCGVCNEWIKKACGKSESFRIIGYPNTKFESVIEKFLCLNKKTPVPFSEVALTRTKHAPFAGPAATDTNTTQRISNLQGKPEKIENLVVCESCASIYPAGEMCLLCSPGSTHLLANYSMVAPLRTKRVADQHHAAHSQNLEDRVMQSPPSISS